MPKARTVKAWEPDHVTGVDPMVGGEVALRVVLPLELAPGLNALLAMQHWARQGTREDVRSWVKRHAETLGSIGDRPHVAVTRYSSREPDECGSDAIGGKHPIDALVHHGMLPGDSRRDITRSDHWAYARQGHGSFVVEVWRVAKEEAPPASGRRSRKGVAA